MSRLISSAAIVTVIVTCIYTSTCRVTAMMVNPPPPPTTSRRSVLTRMPLIVIGAATSLSVTTATVPCNNNNCPCTTCRQQHNLDSRWVVNAYERRDVGDATSSGETKAMNDQAYETNNRLEREGLVLEVRLRIPPK